VEAELLDVVCVLLEEERASPRLRAGHRVRPWRDASDRKPRRPRSRSACRRRALPAARATPRARTMSPRSATDHTRGLNPRLRQRKPRPRTGLRSQGVVPGVNRADVRHGDVRHRRVSYAPIGFAIRWRRAPKVVLLPEVGFGVAEPVVACAARNGRLAGLLAIGARFALYRGNTGPVSRVGRRACVERGGTHLSPPSAGHDYRGEGEHDRQRAHGRQPTARPRATSRDGGPFLRTQIQGGAAKPERSLPGLLGLTRTARALTARDPAEPSEEVTGQGPWGDPVCVARCSARALAMILAIVVFAARRVRRTPRVAMCVRSRGWRDVSGRPRAPYFDPRVVLARDGGARHASGDDRKGEKPGEQRRAHGPQRSSAAGASL
jgi:hypothetical protein